MTVFLIVLGLCLVTGLVFGIVIARAKYCCPYTPTKFERWLFSPTKLPASPSWWWVIGVCGSIGVARFIWNF